MSMRFLGMWKQGLNKREGIGGRENSMCKVWKVRIYRQCLWNFKYFEMVRIQDDEQKGNYRK